MRQRPHRCTPLPLVSALLLCAADAPCLALPDDRPPGQAPAPVREPEPAKAPAPGTPPEPQPVRPIAAEFPSPIITEILYAVPSDARGDANQDGTRQVAGDEFIEISNPHDRPIQLKGWSITDGSNPAKPQVRFVFPACELAPGGVVVVFNGHQGAIPGPVGDEKAAAKANPRFAGALVFTMRAKGSRNALSNAGDMVNLTSPEGRLVQRVRWGKATEPAGRAVLEETAPTTSKGSVFRTSVLKGGEWRPHADEHAEPFSPGALEKSPDEPAPGGAKPGPTPE